MAKSFLALGVKPGDVVTIVTVSCVNSVLCFYALNRIGAVSNYINVLSSEEDITRFIDECDSRYVVSLDLFANKVCNSVEKKNNCKII